MRLRCALSCLLIVAACGRKSNGDDGPGAAIDDGTYESSATTCNSTSQPPQYPSASQMMVLGAFADLTSHTWIISGKELREVFHDADCQLIVIKSIYSNSGSGFATTQARHYLWSPDGCRLAVTYSEVAYPVGKDLSTYFTDSDSQTADIPWEVEHSGLTTIMHTRNEAPWNTLWQPYGCGAEDQIVVRLTKKG